MDAGTVTQPAELPMDDLGTEIARKRREARGIASEAAQRAFKKNQIPAKIAMFDDDPQGFAFISQTTNGWLTRTVLNERQALRLSIALNTYVAGKL